MKTGWDVIVVGAGPAGSTCALALASRGHRVLLLERVAFPREKVCGDCLNPSCWPVFERLGVGETVRGLPQVELRAVEFESAGGARLRFELPPARYGEIALRRSVLDAALLETALARGAQLQMRAVARLERVGAEWRVGGESARFLVAADGRNSTVARLAGISVPRARSARIGLQAHLPRPADFPAEVRMFWHPAGYGGLAPVDAERLNVSIAATPDAIPALKQWVAERFAGAESAEWRTIAPLDRAPMGAARGDGLFLTGDAVRVVEPFTGEGIYYALASGEITALALDRALRGDFSVPEAARASCTGHARLVRHRLWWNRLARWAGQRPRAAEWLLRWSAKHPGLLRALTRKVAAG